MRGVGIPTSAGMTASVPYVKLKGVSLLLVLGMVRCAHRTCGSSSAHETPSFPSRFLIPSTILRLALSTCPLA
ncbi:hypothetical protein HanRHA438_Chr15g0688301 [Helianthus annuus]|nr:hypothetical protein HanRHA438_Chr15g0688301 [Helianthus annuus]